jgi:hypothetical protein
VCVDGTSKVISRKGNAKHSTRTAADAGWYVREGDHKSDGYDDKRNVFWGYEATLVSMFGSGYGSTYPALIAGIGFDRPGKRISEKALWAMDNVINADTPSGHFIGDRAYFPNTAPQNLQIPLPSTDTNSWAITNVEISSITASRERMPVRCCSMVSGFVRR